MKASKGSLWFQFISLLEQFLYIKSDPELLCFGYFALWLVQKIHATIATNQMQNLNQS